MHHPRRALAFTIIYTHPSFPPPATQARQCPTTRVVAAARGGIKEAEAEEAIKEEEEEEEEGEEGEVATTRSSSK